MEFRIKKQLYIVNDACARRVNASCFNDGMYADICGMYSHIGGSSFK